MLFTTDYGPSLRRAFLASSSSFTNITFLIFWPGILEVLKYPLGIIFYLGVIYAAIQTLDYQWNHQDKFRYLVPDPNADVPFLDSAHDVSVNLMIAELLMFAVALGLFGLYYTFSFIKKAVFPKGLRQAARLVLNISRADELPPPYGRNYAEINICKFSFPSKVSQCSMNHSWLDLNIVVFIFQMFTLVFTGALIIVSTRWSASISEDIFSPHSDRGMVLLALYVSVPTWLMIFLFFALFLFIFGHKMRDSLINTEYYWKLFFIHGISLHCRLLDLSSSVLLGMEKQWTLITLKLSSKHSTEGFQKASLCIIISRSRDETHKNGDIVASLNPSQHPQWPGWPWDCRCKRPGWACQSCRTVTLTFCH